MGHDVRQNGDQGSERALGTLPHFHFDSNRFEFELLNPRQSVDWPCLVSVSD
jgi:hypothetical protein